MLKYRLWQLRNKLQENSNPTLTSKKISIAVEQESTRIINLVGYVILSLTLLDYAFLLASSQFFNPTWAYNTAGGLVENVWGFLLGFLLIFYRQEQDLINPKEFKFLSFLSWIVLIIAIGYFSIAPIIVGNAFRIHRSQQTNTNTQIERQNIQVKQYSKQLGQVSSEQLSSLLQNFQQQNSDTEITTTEQLKTNLLSKALQKKQTIQKQLQTQLKQQKRSLLKTTVKWTIGAIVSGMAFFLMWRYTAWTRVNY